MSSTVPLPAGWIQAKVVPSSTLVIHGQGGDEVARVKIIGEATITSVWPYSYRWE